MNLLNSIEEWFENSFGTEKTAFLFYLFSSLMNFIISIFAKFSKFNGKFYIILFYRGFFGVILAQIFFWMQSNNLIDGFDCKKELKLISLRSILVIQCQIMFFYLTPLIPLSEIWILLNTAPIMTYVINYLFYKIKITKKEAFGIIISFIGVILVINPAIILSEFGIDIDNNILPVNTSNNYAKGSLKIFYCIMFLLSACGLAFAWILVRKINLPSSMQNSNLYILFSIIVVPFLITNEENLSYGWLDYFNIFVFFGLSYFIGQNLGIYGLKISKNTGKLTLLNYISVILSYLVEIYKLNEVPSIINIIGMLLILFGLVLVNK